MLGVAIATYLSLYPVVLLVPFALVIVKVGRSTNNRFRLSNNYFTCMYNYTIRL